MILIDATKKRRSLYQSWTVGVTFSILLALMAVAGCGKPFIKVNLIRLGSPQQPVWVGVYFLSQESALDARDNAELCNPEGIPLQGGVVDKEVYPLYPGGEPRRVVRQPFRAEIGWVVVAAGFPNAKPCARQSVPVKTGAKLTITVSVSEECIEVKTD